MQKKSLQFHILTKAAIACMSVIFLSSALPSLTLAAEKKDKNSDEVATLAPVVITVPSILDDTTASSKKSNDIASSTAATPIASTESTTTPAVVADTTTPQPQEAPATTTDVIITPSTKNTPSNTPTYTKTLQNILNQKTNTILRTRTSTSSVSTSTNATTTSAGTFNQITSGGSNQLFPTNYYAPLDKLTPRATYGLSALAMMCGIIGAVYVLREPKEKTVWAVSPRTSPLLEQSLLES